MSTDSNRTDDTFERLFDSDDREIHATFHAPGFPPGHEAEADVFARHEGVPGHDQKALAEARIVLVGAGGLNSWTALGLARIGARSLTIIDPDIVDRTNLSRQYYFGDDLGHPKAIRLARNLVPNAMDVCDITGVALPFEEAVERFPLPADILAVGVDNNACRLACSCHARSHRIPVVFTMLSLDGMRCQSFLQGPNPDDPCLWCALPNLDPEKTTPCAASIVSSCLLASSFALLFSQQVLMGSRPCGRQAFNWTDVQLGTRPQIISGTIRKSPNCGVCT